ncbi:MAG: hypothetical protein ABS46_01575 [Cytophagaceae bacterium SCN 52-12]|nr:MAG: hypothetical protein ABS46_01575 [Cytophagaceae bacterium SCN 52-12]
MRGCSYLPGSIAKRLAGLLPVVCFVLSGVYAQDTRLDSLQMLEDRRIADMYSYTGNMAAFLNRNRPDIGFASAQAGFVSGDFKRPMEASSSSAYTLATGGIKTIGRYRFLADFSYRKTYDKRLAWSAVQDPYEGNPFIWADSSSGDWDRDHIYATAGMATLLRPSLRAGIKADYNTGSGARTSEPKPFYRIRNISLAPGLVWNITPSDELGVDGVVTFLQEENEIGFYSKSNVLLYRLRGYGTFSRSPFVSGERRRRGTGWEGGLHYRRSREKYDLLVSAGVSQRNEDVFEGVARKQVTGYYTGTGFKGLLHFSLGDVHRGKAIRILYTRRNGYADDVVFNAESASYASYSVELNLAAWTTAGQGRRSIKWDITPSLGYIAGSDHATGMRFTAAAGGGTAGVTWRRQLTERLRIRIQPFAGYFAAMDHSFSVRNDQVIIQELVRPDYDYFSRRYAKGGGILGLEVTPGKTRLIHSVSFRSDIRRAEKKQSGSRTLLQINYLTYF